MTHHKSFASSKPTGALLSVDELLPSLRIYGCVQTTSAMARHRLIHSLTPSTTLRKETNIKNEEKPCHKEKGHKLLNKEEKTKQPQTKENEGLTVAEVTYEVEGKKYVPLSWRKSAQKRLQDSRAP